jgi:hypothetical protein
VVHSKSINVLEEHVTSIFRIKEQDQQETNVKAGGMQSSSAFMLISYVAYSSTLKMEAMCSSKMSVYFEWTTQQYIPEDRILHNHQCENLKSYNYNSVTKVIE